MENKNKLNKALKLNIEHIEKIQETRQAIPDLSVIIGNIKSLLARGADVNTQSKTGKTLLHLFVAKQLVAYQDHLNHPPKFIRPAYQDIEKASLISFIATRHPNPFIKDNDGCTPSLLAAQNGETKSHQILVSYENSYQASCIAEAISSLSEIMQGIHYKKAEELVQAEDSQEYIIERYHPTTHQPQSVVQANEHLGRIIKQLSGRKDHQNG